MAASTISGSTRHDLVLNSPVGAKPAHYKWPLITYDPKGQRVDGAEDIVETIRWVGREYVDFKPAIENLLADKPDLTSYDCIKGLCDKYNKMADMVSKLNKGTSVAPKTSSRASRGLLKHILRQVYNGAIKDPTELTKYSPFSSEAYGETSFDFMAQMIEKNQFRPREDDIFTDLGSGVGHVVLQMAAMVDCKKCYGIEISDAPAEYARVMEDQFDFWMSWHGKSYSDFELIHGDFLDKKHAEILNSSTHILVNNYAFRQDVDHKLKQKFIDLKEGTQILSSKPFCSPKQRDPGSIMKVVEIQPDAKTSKPLPYYLHTLVTGDASARQVPARQGRPPEKSKPSKKRKTEILSDQSEESISEEFTGPTTRKAWSEWCNSSNRTPSEDSKLTHSRNNSTDTEHYESAIENDDNDVKISKSKRKITGNKRVRKTQETVNASSTRSNSEQLTSLPAAGQTSTKSNQKLVQKRRSTNDKKRDRSTQNKEISDSSSTPDAQSSTLYSINTKTTDLNTETSAAKIPNIVIKVKASVDTKDESSPAKTKTPRARRAPKPNRASDETKKKQDDKINDENGKKPRQRRKAALATSQAHNQTDNKAGSTLLNPTSSPAATSQQPTAPTSNGTRSKRVQAAAAAKITKKSASVSKKKITNSGKSSNSSLDLLHAKTIESVSGSAGHFFQPAPGCKDHNLRSIVDTPSLPKVVIKDLSMFIGDFLGPKTLERFSECTRQELMKFAKKLQQPGAKESLMREVERERSRNRMLMKERDELIRDVKSLNERIPKAMKVHCDNLGIINTPRSIVHHLGTLLKRHQDLLSYQMQLESMLSTNQRTVNPPAAHSSSSQGLSNYRNLPSTSATLDLSLKQNA